MGRAIRKRLATWGVVTVGVVLVVVATLHTPPVKTRALAWVIGLLEGRGLVLTTDGLDYNLFTGSVTLVNVRLAARGHEAAPFFTADRVTADVPLVTYTGTLILDEVSVVGGRVAMRTDADGVSNLPPGGGPTPETPRRLDLRALHLQDLTFEYDNQATALQITASGIDAAMTHQAIRVFDGASGPFAVGGGVDLRWRGRTLRVDPIDSRLAFEGNVVSLQDLPLATSMGTFSVSGRITRVLDAPSLELEYVGSLDVARAAEWAPPPMAVAGTSRVNGAVTGPIGATEVSARFDAQALSVGAERNLTVSGALLLDRDLRVSINRILAAPESGGDIEASVELPPGDDPLSATAEWRGVDARVFLRVLALTVPPVATRLDGQAQYRGGEIPRLAATADATAIAEADATPLAGRVRFDVNAGRWSMTHALDAGGVSVDGAASGDFDWTSLTRSTLEGESRATIASLAAADRALAPHGVRVPAAVREAAGAIEAQVTLGGSFGSPSATMEVEAPAFELPGLGPSAITAGITADASHVLVDPIAISAGETHASGQVAIDLGGDTLSGSARLTAADLRELQDTVPEAWQVAGALEAEAQLSGTLDAPVIEASLSSPTLTFAGDTYTALTGRLGYRDDAIHVASLSVNKDSGSATVRGRYGLDGSYAVDLDLTNLAWSRVLAGETASRLVMGGQFSGEGTLEAPAGAGQIEFSLTGGVAGDLVGEGRVDLEVNGDHARARALIPNLGAFADGVVTLAAPYHYRGVAVLNHLDLATIAPLAAAVPGQVEGTVSLTASVTGAVSGDQPPDVQANLQQVQATLAGVPLSLPQPAAVAWTPGDLTVREFSLALGSSTITASGAWAGRDDTVFNAAFRGELAEVTQAATAFGIEMPVRARGRVTAEVFATARPGDLIATVEFADGYVEASDGVAIEGLTASAGLTGDVFTLHAATGHVVAAKAAGQFSARGQATLPDLDPRRATGAFTIEDTAFDAAGVPVTQTRPSQFSITRGILSMDDVIWEAAGSRLIVGGNVDLSSATPALNLRLDGVAVLRVLSAFAPSVGVDGTATIEAYIGGTPAQPNLTGEVTLNQVEVSLTSPRLVVSDLSGPIRLAGNRIELRGLTGTANGGTVVVDGGAVLDGLTVGNGELYLQASGVAVEYPRGLRSEIDALLTLSSGGVAPVVRGDVRVQRSAYTDPISLAALARRNTASGVRGAPSAIDEVRLDIAVTTVDDMRVDNNYGRFDTGAQLRLVGTVGDPGMSGRATLREGGTVYAAGRTFTITRGTVSFTNLSRIEPDLDIQAETRLAGQGVVTMTLQGTPDRLSFDLASENPDSTQEDIANALFGGGVSGSNALTLLSSDLLGLTGRQLGLDALRLDRGDVVRDEFREDPSLLFQDNQDPVTRLTLSKRLYDNVEFLISQNLRQNGKTTFVVSYYPLPALELRAISRDDATLGLGVRHEVTFGGSGVTRTATTRPEVPVTAVIIEGDPAPVTEAELRRRVRLEAGDIFDYYTWQRDLDGLTRLMVERGYVEAKVRGERREVDGGVEVVYRIARGPETRVVVEGITLPDSELDQLREMWSRAVFDRFVVEDAEARVRTFLLGSGLLEGTVSGRMETGGGLKTLHLAVDPGTASGPRTFGFRGNTALSNSQLEAVIIEAGLEIQGWLDREALAERLQAHYREQGFLSAQVRVDPAEVTDAAAVLPIVITEGPQAVIGGVYWNGVGDARKEVMPVVAGVVPGEPYTLDLVNEARDRVDRRYRLLGYNAAEVAVTSAPGDDPDTVNVAFTVTEGPRQILAEVVTSGATRTRDGVVRRALRLRVGEPVNLEQWAQARKRLFDTNVFRAVDIQAVPIGEVVDGDQQVRARVIVEEYPHWRVRYGAQVDRERQDAGEDGRLDVSLGAIGEIRNQNLFGQAISGGVASRLERDYQRVNTFLQNSTFFGLPIRSGLFATVSRDNSRFDGEVVAVTDIRSLSFEQRWRRRRSVELTYGYRFETNRTFEPDPLPGVPPLDVRTRLARLHAASFMDRRNDPVNATSGTFTSVSVEQGVRALGSDSRYGKLFAQQQFFLSLGRFVLASRALGGYGYGADRLVYSDRFFVGGGTTVRGYAENGLGPRDPFFGDPAGGGKMLIVNQELRIPIYKWVNAVGFVDAGNAFDEEESFSWGEIKFGYGVGLRLASPVGLLRLDFGIPGSSVRTSTRQPNQFGSGRWYFGLGHIF